MCSGACSETCIGVCSGVFVFIVVMGGWGVGAAGFSNFIGNTTTLIPIFFLSDHESIVLFKEGNFGQSSIHLRTNLKHEHLRMTAQH